MTMQTDVKGFYSTTSPSVISTSRQRLKGYTYVGSGTAGLITFTNGNGNTIWQVQISSQDSYAISVIFPGEGILAENGLTVTFTGALYVSTIYG
jgi:hypothetical protein